MFDVLFPGRFDGATVAREKAIDRYNTVNRCATGAPITSLQPSLTRPSLDQLSLEVDRQIKSRPSRQGAQASLDLAVRIAGFGIGAEPNESTCFDDLAAMCLHDAEKKMVALGEAAPGLRQAVKILFENIAIRKTRIAHSK